MSEAHDSSKTIVKRPCPLKRVIEPLPSGDFHDRQGSVDRLRGVQVVWQQVSKDDAELRKAVDG